FSIALGLLRPWRLRTVHLAALQLSATIPTCPPEFAFYRIGGCSSRIARARSVSPLRWLAGVVAGPAEAQRTDCRRPRLCTRAPVRSGAIPVVRTRPVTTSCVAAWRTQAVAHPSQPAAL